MFKQRKEGRRKKSHREGAVNGIEEQEMATFGKKFFRKEIVANTVGNKENRAQHNL